MEDWPSKKRILVILAHPDDPEFFCGGTIVKWTNKGHHVDYLLMTKGEKGINPHFDNQKDIVRIRIEEQRCAADRLNVGRIHYLDYFDGMLTPGLEVRKKVIARIRKNKPDIIVTCDPTTYFMHGRYINHPDHRAAGKIVLNAVFPGVDNRLYFPSLLEEGLLPHHVEEVWASLPKEPNIVLDVTQEWPIKLAALECHQSQIGEIAEFRDRMTHKGIKNKDGTVRYEEKFHRIVFK